MTHVDKLAEAKSEAALAKARLGDTFDAIKERLAPANLLGDAVSDVKARSIDLAEIAGDIVRQRPATVAAGTAGVALLVAHRPILRLARTLFARK